MFSIQIGATSVTQTHQAPFPTETVCVHCGALARIAFTVLEKPKSGVPIEKQRFVCDLHPNDPDGEGYWLHDCCAVAVYFCSRCLRPTALYNQA